MLPWKLHVCCTVFDPTSVLLCSCATRPMVPQDTAGAVKHERSKPKETLAWVTGAGVTGACQGYERSKKAVLIQQLPSHNQSFTVGLNSGLFAQLRQHTHTHCWDLCVFFTLQQLYPFRRVQNTSIANPNILTEARPGGRTHLVVAH